MMLVCTERAGLLQSVSVACDPTSGEGCRDLEEESLIMGFEDVEDFSYWSILNNNGDIRGSITRLGTTYRR